MTKAQQKRWCKKVARQGGNYDDCMAGYDEAIRTGPTDPLENIDFGMATGPTDPLENIDFGKVSIDQNWLNVFDCCMMRNKPSCCTGAGVSTNPAVTNARIPANKIKNIQRSNYRN